MTKKITQSIKAFHIKKKEIGETEDTSALMSLNENIDRPEVLKGCTYKLTVPEHISRHAFYVTINNIVLNEGTDQEVVRPFEIFITSKSMFHFEWIVALTRIVSAVFRKGGDSLFIIEELKSVFNPQGGYFSGGGYKNSIINEIGDIMQKHFEQSGIIQKEDLPVAVATPTVSEVSQAPSSTEKRGLECPSCGEYSLIPSEGCAKCASCSYSACS